EARRRDRFHRDRLRNPTCDRVRRIRLGRSQGRRGGSRRAAPARHAAADEARAMSDADFQDALQFEEYAREALGSLPPELRDQMSNVEIVVDDEPPPGQPLLRLYE